jgi:hypothetical protein
MSERNQKPASTGLPAGEWLSVFRSAKVETERLEAAKSTQGRATIIGNFLARMVGREVPIEVDGRSGKAALRKTQGRARKQLYYFEVVLDDGQIEIGDGPTPALGKSVATENQLRREQAKKPDVGSRDNPIDRREAAGFLATRNDEVW